MQLKLGPPPTLTTEKYNEAIIRHGRLVRWLTGIDCSCVSLNGFPDPNHDTCQGRGKIYRVQTEFDIVGENSPHEVNTIALPTPHDIGIVRPLRTPVVKVKSVQRRGGNYTVNSFTGTEIEISASVAAPDLPVQWNEIAVDYSFTRKLDYTQTPNHVGDGILILGDLVYVDPITSQKFQCEIVEVVSVIDSEPAIPVTYDVVSFFRNVINLDKVPPNTAILTCVVKAVPPFNFLLTGISEKRRYEDAYISVGGEAMITVPYNVYLGAGDLISLLEGERRAEDIVPADFVSEKIELRAFDVARVLRIIDSRGDDSYVENVDWVQNEMDKIKWLSTGKRPSTSYTVVYMARPTYSILDDVPMIRTSENKKLPKRLGLKTFEKVNTQFKPRTDIVTQY